MKDSMKQTLEERITHLEKTLGVRNNLRESDSEGFSILDIVKTKSFQRLRSLSSETGGEYQLNERLQSLDISFIIPGINVTGDDESQVNIWLTRTGNNHSPDYWAIYADAFNNERVSNRSESKGYLEDIETFLNKILRHYTKVFKRNSIADKNFVIPFPGGELKQVPGSSAKSPEGYSKFEAEIKVSPTTAESLLEDYPGYSLNSGVISLQYDTDYEKPWVLEIYLFLESISSKNEDLQLVSSQEMIFSTLTSASKFISLKIKNPFRKFCKFHLAS